MSGNAHEMERALREQAREMMVQATALQERAQQIHDSGLPIGTPLLADTARAAEIFSISPTTLYRLRQSNAEFRALTIKTGREVLYDVPKIYAWFGQRLGTEMCYA